jgi:soluble lytic murein transglycosylase-like protein
MSRPVALAIRAARGVLFVAVAAGAAPAHAELWGYVDGNGVAHVAATQLDSRYRLVLGDHPAADPGAPTRVPGKTDRTGGLLTWLEIAPEVRVLLPLLREAARETGVDVELLKAIIAVESGFNARAVSPRGAMGLMQITPTTADRYATPAERQRPAVQRLLEPRTNVLTGARMLADLTRRLGSIDVALAAWNSGEGTVRKHGGKLPPIDETRAHVHLVLELYWALLQNSQTQNATRMRIHKPGS